MVQTYVIWYGHQLAILCKKVADGWAALAFDLNLGTINDNPFWHITMPHLSLDTISSELNQLYNSDLIQSSKDPVDDRHLRWELSMALFLLKRTPSREALETLDKKFQCDVCLEFTPRNQAKYDSEGNFACPCCAIATDKELDREMLDYYDSYCNDNLANFSEKSWM